MTRERQSNKHLFSTLIKCKECCWSFRRTVRKYKNSYICWVCSSYNGRRTDSCPNAVIVDEDELNDKIGGMRKEIERLENELKMVSYHLTKGEQLEDFLNGTFREIEDITDVRQMTNAQLKRIIKKIEVDKEGNVDIYLCLFGNLGLDEQVLIEDNTVPINNDET